MPRRAEIMPRIACPIALPRAEAAAACGISPGYFDRLVAAGIIPAGRRLAIGGEGGKTVWLFDELRAALADLPAEGEALAGDNHVVLL